MNLCKCGDSYLNTGFSKCPVKKTPKIAVLVPYLGSDGSVNRFDSAAYSILSDSAKKAYFVDKVNAADPADRWYPLQVDNVAGERAASDFETLTSKQKVKVRPGVRNYSMSVISGSPQLQAKLEAWGCSEAFGIFIIDIENNFNGIMLDDGFLEPYPIDVNTWDIIAVWAIGDTGTKVQIGFDFSRDLSDSDERMASANDLSPVNISRVLGAGLIDAYATYTAISTTGFTTTIKSKDGSMLNPVVVRGLIAADFALYNLTTPGAVTILTAPETSPGVYAITFAAQTSGDELRLTPTKDNFDFSAVVANHVTIP